MADFIITNIRHGLSGLLGLRARFKGAVRVRDGVIREIGDLIVQPDEQVVDASGCVVMPGFVNTHHHLFQSVMKAVPAALNDGLDSWLMNVPFRFWPSMNAEALEVSATIGLAELALSGVTTLADLHYIFSDRFDYDPAALLFNTAARFGMRFVLCRGGLTVGRPWHASDIAAPPTETLDQMIQGIEAAARQWHDPGPMPMTRIAAAPVTTVFNLRDGEAREIAQAARAEGLRLHTHLSENKTYVNATLERFGMRPVAWMADQDWLGQDVWFAHLVECTNDELARLAEAGTAMAHCPQANARLGSGIAPVPAFSKAGGIVSLAVDGTAANEAGDMAQAIYATFALHRAVGGADATSAETVLHWATAGGARTLGIDGVGTIEVGKAADLVIARLDHPRYFGLHDVAVGPIVCGGEIRVRDSFVGGRPVVSGGRLPWLDMAALEERAAHVVERLQRAQDGR